jgi:hypothetical protein
MSKQIQKKIYFEIWHTLSTWLLQTEAAKSIHATVLQDPGSFNADKLPLLLMSTNWLNSFAFLK